MMARREKQLVLVVDDHADCRTVARRYLQGWGYDTVEAVDGISAIDAALKEKPDLILLDVEMPRLSGFEVLPRLRAEPSLALTPVVILTAMATQEDHTTGIQLGADDFLTKPIDSALLRARVTSLLQKEKYRHEVEQLRRDFTAMIVHDIRNPLTVIEGYASLLKEEPEILGSDFSASAVGRILENTGRAIALVSEMLDISQLEAGRVKLHRRSQNLSDLVGRLADDQGLIARHKEVELLMDIEPDVVTSYDDKKFAEVVINILSNAIKFTPKGGQVRVKLGRKSDGTIEITVADTGPGIPSDQIDLVFMPWKRAKQRGHAVKGYGLGLAISKMIVDAHGGQIGVDSEAGNGANFYVRLPYGANGQGELEAA